MLAAAFDAGGQPQQLVFRDAFGRNDVDDFWFALGQRAGLVDHQRVDALEPLQRLRVADQDAGMRAAADSRP